MLMMLKKDYILLKEVVREQVYLPSEATLEHCQDCWYVDDFCVMV